MIGTILWLSAMLSANAPVGGPSFRCDPSLPAVERMICGDPELRAYDRAMAFAYSRKWRSTGRWNSQREWLKLRDDCGVQRACILGAYKDWVEGLDSAAKLKPSLRRKVAPRPDGSDLMLGTMQSPTGRVTRLGDEGDLFVRPLGEDWYLFQVNAAHNYDPHDGLGANVSTSEAVGLVHLKNGRGTFRSGEPDSPEPCSIRFTRLPKDAWRLVETGSCSGIGSTLTGIYGR